MAAESNDFVDDRCYNSAKKWDVAKIHCHSWESLAHQLELDENAIESIRMGSREPDQIMYEVLRTWQERSPKEFSLSNLVDALQEISMFTTVKSIKDRYKTTTPRSIDFDKELKGIYSSQLKLTDGPGQGTTNGETAPEQEETGNTSPKANFADKLWREKELVRRRNKLYNNICTVWRELENCMYWLLRKSTDQEDVDALREFVLKEYDVRIKSTDEIMSQLELKNFSTDQLIMDELWKNLREDMRLHFRIMIDSLIDNVAKFVQVIVTPIKELKMKAIDIMSRSVQLNMENSEECFQNFLDKTIEGLKIHFPKGVAYSKQLASIYGDRVKPGLGSFFVNLLQHFLSGGSDSFDTLKIALIIYVNFVIKTADYDQKVAKQIISWRGESDIPREFVEKFYLSKPNEQNAQDGQTVSKKTPDFKETFPQMAHFFKDAQLGAEPAHLFITELEGILKRNLRLSFELASADLIADKISEITWLTSDEMRNKYLEFDICKMLQDKSSNKLEPSFIKQYAFYKDDHYKKIITSEIYKLFLEHKEKIIADMKESISSSLEAAAKATEVPNNRHKHKLFLHSLMYSANRLPNVLSTVIAFISECVYKPKQGGSGSNFIDYRAVAKQVSQELIEECQKLFCNDTNKTTLDIGNINSLVFEVLKERSAISVLCKNKCPECGMMCELAEHDSDIKHVTQHRPFRYSLFFKKDPTHMPEKCCTTIQALFSELYYDWEVPVEANKSMMFEKLYKHFLEDVPVTNDETQYILKRLGTLQAQLAK